jgi:hypothetical protein
VSSGGASIGAGIGSIGSNIGEFVGGMGVPTLPDIDPEWLLM